MYKKIALGLHVGHDRTVAVIENGKLIGHLAQEKVDNIKHSPSNTLPFEAMETLLEHLNIKLSEISCIGVTFATSRVDKYANHWKEAFHFRYGIDDIPIYSIGHHEAHAYAVFCTSPFDESHILISDGAGDYHQMGLEAESIFYGNKEEIIRLSSRLQDFPPTAMSHPSCYLYEVMDEKDKSRQISLGRKYTQVTYSLGFKPGQEGKTMGLAAYGKPLITKNIEINSSLHYELTFGDILKELDDIRKIKKLSAFEFRKRYHAEIAATHQFFLEESLFKIVSMINNGNAPKNLCFSGGVALNCLANGKLRKKLNLTNNMYVLPASGDEGLSIGAAFAAYQKNFKFAHNVGIFDPYLGISWDDTTIEMSIKNFGLKTKKITEKERIELIAKLLSNNKIVAIHRGRSESGPRALCHRSIIANPSKSNMKDYLNLEVKHREKFRPFAPVVTEEDMKKYFDINYNSRYMLFAENVKDEYKEKLAAVIHIDGTARIQSVSENNDSFMYALLKEFEKYSGVAVLLNTSFNIANQPIVEHPDTAIETYLTTKIDALMIGSYLLTKDETVE